MKIIIIILAIFSLPSVELGHLESKYYEYHNIILGNRLSRRLLVVSGITANANPPIPTLRKEGRKEEHIFLVVSYYAHPFPLRPTDRPTAIFFFFFLFFHPRPPTDRPTTGRTINVTLHRFFSPTPQF